MELPHFEKKLLGSSLRRETFFIPNNNPNIGKSLRGTTSLSSKKEKNIGYRTGDKSIRRELKSLTNRTKDSFNGKGCNGRLTKVGGNEARTAHDLDLPDPKRPRENMDPTKGSVGGAIYFKGKG